MFRDVTRRHRLLGCSMASIIAFTPLPALAQVQTFQFDIGSQSLDGALRAFARTTHLQVLFDKQLVRGKRSVVLTGSHTAEQGIDILLAGSGLQADRGSRGAYVVKPAQARAAGTVPVFAQQSDQESTPDEIMVTGSRIRQTQADQPTPLSIITSKQIEDNGYVQAGQALNDDPSINPSYSTGQLNGRNASSNGTQYPGLFNLGSGRTLTLVNGQRMVSSTPLTSLNAQNPTSGAGVDTNLIPVGLIERIDIVQSGGAAVYGSDAIAGVVNYVLKDHFKGVQLDMQSGISVYGDYPVKNARFTAGTDFLDHRGNVAIDLEWSKTEPLLSWQRPYTARYVNYTVNSSPPFYPLPDNRFWEANSNGVIFMPTAVGGGAPSTALLLQVNGKPVQFGGGGTLQSYDPGTIYGVPFAEGGQGFEERNLNALWTGVERRVFNLVSHYDFTDHLRVSASLLYGRAAATDPLAQYTNQWVLNGLFSTQSGTNAAGASTSPNGAVPFYANNPYLPAATAAQLKAAYPAFATGSPLLLSIVWPDLLSSYKAVTSTEQYSGHLALDGDFNALNRNFYWTTSYNHGLVRGNQLTPALNIYNFAQAINSAVNSTGQIVCAVNVPTVTIAACSPINLFNPGGISKAAQKYVTTTDGATYRNTEDDFLATLGGSLYTLPAGDLKFSAGFEHRADTARFVPSPSAQLGLVNAGVPVPYQSGKYQTNEYSAEFQIPVIGKSFSLPFVQSLDLNGAFRHVENSLTSSENVWDAGVRWRVVPGITFRGSLSRNFRAPLLSQVDAPTATTYGYATDPCDYREINQGIATGTRLANCRALFAANPSFGLQGKATIAPGSSVDERLANFATQTANAATVLTTSAGNPNLQNEVSHTQTFGIVLQPRFVDGLTFSADRIRIHLVGGLSLFTGSNFEQACFDTNPQVASACGFVTRDPKTGFITTSTTTYYNAGYNYFHGEVYNLDYVFPVSMIVGNGRDYGKVDLNVSATHSTLAASSVTGFDRSVSSDTVVQPKWVGHLNLGYSHGPLRLTYQAIYRGPALLTPGANPDNTAFPYVKANVVQNVSIQYTVKEHYRFRFGINNLTNALPSFPTLTYGDLIGRQYSAGVRITF